MRASVMYAAHVAHCWAHPLLSSHRPARPGALPFPHWHVVIKVNGLPSVPQPATTASAAPVGSNDATVASPVAAPSAPPPAAHAGDDSGGDGSSLPGPPSSPPAKRQDYHATCGPTRGYSTVALNCNSSLFLSLSLSQPAIVRLWAFSLLQPAPGAAAARPLVLLTPSRRGGCSLLPGTQPLRRACSTGYSLAPPSPSFSPSRLASLLATGPHCPRTPQLPRRDRHFPRASAQHRERGRLFGRGLLVHSRVLRDSPKA